MISKIKPRELAEWVKVKLRSRIAKYQVIGYPKCGNTWLRVLVGGALKNIFGIKGDEVFGNFFVSWSAAPNIFWSHGTKHRMDFVGPNNRDPNIKFKTKTVLLVRDPRDILVSFYYHELFRNGIESVEFDAWRQILGNGCGDITCLDEITISKYVRSPLRGIDYIIHFMNYWYDHRDCFNALKIVKYEDLHANTHVALEDILRFFNVPLDKKSISKAVEEASFDNMRKLELDDRSDFELPRPQDLNDKRTFHVRKGKVSGYLDELEDPDIEYINDRIERNLYSVFGYE